ncbi:MAG: heme exporter protein CcmD [Chryseolinea sp.]
MNWHNTHEFFAMGGYGLYVWGSVGTVAAFVLGELLALRWRRQAALQQGRPA